MNLNYLKKSNEQIINNVFYRHRDLAWDGVEPYPVDVAIHHQDIDAELYTINREFDNIKYITRK
jgi:hypothetical protein